MTSLTNTTSRITFSGNDSTVAFDLGFWVQAAADVSVWIRVNATSVETEQVLTTDYAVTSLDEFTGATVTMVTAPASGETLVVYRDQPLTQDTDLTSTQSLFPVAITRALDYLMAAVQRLEHETKRSFRIKTSRALRPDPMSVTASELVGEFLSWDSSGNPIPASISSTAASDFMTPVFVATDVDDFQNQTDLKAVDVDSATTVDLGATLGRVVDIAGTVTITGFGTVAAGRVVYGRFLGILTFTHNATSMILPTTSNITTAAGDRFIMVSLGSGNWICWSYQRADGTALA